MKWFCLCLSVMIMIFSGTSYAAEASIKIITVNVKEIYDLPQWYQEKQSYIMKDISERYHHKNTNTTRYLIVDSLDQKKNITVESTKNSIKLFLKNDKSSNLIDSNPQGIMSVQWSDNSEYFSYLKVTNIINEAQVLGTLYLVKIGTNITDIKKIRLRNDISIGDVVWDKRNEKFIFTNYEKLYIYFPNNGVMYEVKDIWSKRPSGNPQRIDNIFFSADGINLIFRYCGYYAGDKYEYYQIDCSELK